MSVMRVLGEMAAIRLQLALGVGLLLLSSALLLDIGGSVMAETLESPSYRFEESSVGSGSSIESSSDNFQSSSTLGDAAIGASVGEDFQSESGSNTSPDPRLSFSIEETAVSFGSFTASAATVTTSTFKVINYTSYGYVVQMVGSPPKNGAHQLPPMTTTGPSVAGDEQFGINLVANTSPTSVGANPDHGDFGFGAATSNYGTSNQYRFVSGETIASAPKSSGETLYTITYLVNVSSTTPGGVYTAPFELICTGTY